MRVGRLQHISEVIGPVMDDLEKRMANPDLGDDNPTQMPNLAPVTPAERAITRCVECGAMGGDCGCVVRQREAT